MLKVQCIYVTPDFPEEIYPGGEYLMDTADGRMEKNWEIVAAVYTTNKLFLGYLNKKHFKTMPDGYSHKHSRAMLNMAKGDK